MGNACGCHKDKQRTLLANLVVRPPPLPPLTTDSLLDLQKVTTLGCKPLVQQVKLDSGRLLSAVEFLITKVHSPPFLESRTIRALVVLENIHKALPTINEKHQLRLPSTDFNIVLFQKQAYELVLPLLENESAVVTLYAQEVLQTNLAQLYQIGLTTLLDHQHRLMEKLIKCTKGSIDTIQQPLRKQAFLVALANLALLGQMQQSEVLAPKELSLRLFAIAESMDTQDQLEQKKRVLEMLGRVQPRGTADALADIFMQELILLKRKSLHFQRVLQAVQSKDALQSLLNGMCGLITSGDQPFDIKIIILQLLSICHSNIDSAPLLAHIAPTLLGSLQSQHLYDEQYSQIRGAVVNLGADLVATMQSPQKLFYFIELLLEKVHEDISSKAPAKLIGDQLEVLQEILQQGKCDHAQEELPLSLAHKTLRLCKHKAHIIQVLNVLNSILALSVNKDAPIFYPISLKTGNLILQTIHHSIHGLEDTLNESQVSQTGDVIEQKQELKRVNRLCEMSVGLSGVLLGLMRRSSLHCMVQQYFTFQVETLLQQAQDDSHYNLLSLVSLNGIMNLSLLVQDKALLQSMQKISRKSNLQAVLQMATLTLATPLKNDFELSKYFKYSNKMILFERYDLNMMTQQLEKHYGIKYSKEMHMLKGQEISFMAEDKMLQDQLGAYVTLPNEEISVSHTANDSKWSGTMQSRVEPRLEDSFEMQIHQQERQQRNELRMQRLLDA